MCIFADPAVSVLTAARSIKSFAFVNIFLEASKPDIGLYFFMSNAASVTLAF